MEPLASVSRRLTAAAGALHERGPAVALAAELLTERMLDLVARFEAVGPEEAGVVERGWWALTGDEVCGWSAVVIPDLGLFDGPARYRAARYVVERLQAEAIVYVFDGLGVYPKTQAGWRELHRHRAEHGGSIEGHPDAVRSLVGIVWTARDVVQVAYPFDGDRPGPLVTVPSEGVTTLYNVALRGLRMLDSLPDVDGPPPPDVAADEPLA